MKALGFKDPNNEKALNQRMHALSRAAERYNSQLTHEDIRSIVKKIRNGESRMLKRQSIRVTVREVEYKGTVYRLVYDSKRKEVSTFLPPDARVRGEIPKIESREHLLAYFLLQIHNPYRREHGTEKIKQYAPRRYFSYRIQHGDKRYTVLYNAMTCKIEQYVDGNNYDFNEYIVSVVSPEMQTCNLF